MGFFWALGGTFIIRQTYVYLLIPNHYSRRRETRAISILSGPRQVSFEYR